VFVVIMATWLILFAGMYDTFHLFKFVFIISAGYIAMLFDIRQRRIPNELVLSMLAGWLLLIVLKMVFDTQAGILILLDSALGAVIGGGGFFIVYIISRKGLGGGDVKFMAAAGLYLGLGGTIPAILYGTVLAALTGLILILLKKITRKDAIPLAPFLFIGIMITVFMP